MDFGFASVGGITVICYLVAQGIKATKLDNKWLPAICGALGGVLGLGALIYGMPEFPATDYITAFAVGAVSGWAATGVNQTVKQLSTTTTTTTTGNTETTSTAETK